MATWEKGKEKPVKKKAGNKKKKNYTPLVVFVLLIACFAYISFQNSQVLPETTLTISTDYESGLGQHLLFVNSNNHFDGITVFIGGRQARQATWENPYTFEFYVTPYDETGFTPVVIEAIDTQNRFVSNTSFALDIDFFVAGSYLNNIMFYSKDFAPLPKARNLMLNSQEVLFFFELENKQSQINSQIITAYIPLIQGITSKGKNVQSYAVGVERGEWISCTDSNSTMVTLQECGELFESGPSILLEFPEFPTTQVIVSNQTITIQPRVEDLELATNTVLQLFDMPQLTTKQAGQLQ